MRRKKPIRGKGGKTNSNREPTNEVAAPQVNRSSKVLAPSEQDKKEKTKIVLSADNTSMQGREIGCKTLGCGAAIFIVLVCFYGMLAATEKVAKQAKAKQDVRTAQVTMQNLQATAISVSLYESARGHLPPTESPEVFKNALSPKFLNDTSVLYYGRDSKPFLPNPVVSAKKRKHFAASGLVFLLTTEPNASNVRTVLFLSGEVRDVSTEEWQSIIAPKMPPPAPVGLPKPVPNPARSP